MARLDRLGPAKEAAEIGAAIGREFSHELLAAVVRKPAAELDLSLDRLIQAGLLFRKGVPPHATYSFKHALVQDAAYGTLLRQPRRALHARIAETIESRFADMANSQPDLLARHYTEAGLIEKAAVLWAKLDCGHWIARLLSRPSSSLRVHLTKSRLCPARRRFVVTRSSFRLD
jgi:predicted ATPase